LSGPHGATDLGWLSAGIPSPRRGT